MANLRRIPIALTIAGSDSGGGAGIQADLKTFAALGVHGTSAITCLTAQNPKGVTGIQAAESEIVRRQIEAVFAELPPAAVKTGMLFSAEIIKVVAAFFREAKHLPLVVDPVMVATSGARLLEPAAMAALTDDLLPLATLITPNLDEAELLTRTRLRSVEDLRRAARELRARFGCAALVKGGHLRGLVGAVDVFFDGKTELLLTAPFLRGAKTHGTGCTYSAAIAGHLALGRNLPKAVAAAKDFITQAIAQSQRVAKHSVLNCFWRQAPVAKPHRENSLRGQGRGRVLRRRRVG
jgi:hydroxymethylpyrimidine/phosphomethylpyrimidine kinase